MPVLQLELIEELAPSVEYADQFAVGDRVIDISPKHPHSKNKGCGMVMSCFGEFISIKWDGTIAWQTYGKFFINQDKWLSKAVIDESFSGIFPDVENIPEKTLNPRKHGCIETYLVKGSKGKTYEYQRYVYLDDKKIYRHHHIPQKQTEAIAAMWAGGASAKEICTALGKKYQSK